MHLFLERRAWAAPRLGSLAPAGRRLRAVPRPPHGVLPPSAADVRAEAHRTSAIMLLLQVVLLWSLSCITGAQQQAAADSHGDDATTHRELSLEALEAMPVNFSSGHRIVGGLEASPGQFPYQVGIFIEKGPIIKRGTSFCGGSILSERIVMTAAHCTPRDTLKITVYAGALSIRRDESPKITVDAFYAHERFSKDLLNDIALLHLSSRLEFNGELSPVLRYVESTALTNLICQVPYALFALIDESHLCVSGWFMKGTCMGDSGGPLTIKKDGKIMVVGIVSFGIKFSCNVSWPPVFTRVTSYLEWIKYWWDELEKGHKGHGVKWLE
ncbi:brachyurin-like isoform X2 [Frankliniella occidentalis]|uniref:Brachyurin-like isoform X2 n=1 Tax=Frankliniella occidentalis TaxID=133901 RepID=A0A9C6X1B8_FRAOC|nr:brachyurin-like isoform X2 [Frankliniella occidentalis]